MLIKTVFDGVDEQEMPRKIKNTSNINGLRKRSKCGEILRNPAFGQITGSQDVFHHPTRLTSESPNLAPTRSTPPKGVERAIVSIP
jgi:hypothetical protein